MRVLVCIPCLMIGGTEVQTLSLVHALVQGGHEVTVACYFEFDESMVWRYSLTPNPSTVGRGVKVMCLSANGSRPKGVLHTAWHLWRGLRRMVNDVKPDVAHVQYMAPGTLPIILLRLLRVKKIVATVHTAADIYSKNGLRVIHWLTEHVLSGFQCITKRAEKSFFGTIGTPFKDKHFTIYNCLSSSPATSFAKGRGGKGFVCVGVVSRLEKIKGMDLAVPAFKKLKGNVRLLVVGDGSLRQEMEQDAGDGVIFVGRQQPEKLHEYYDKIDILLMPSRSEGFGLTAIEGMARGCVPVVANVGGLPEVVQEGVSGLLHKTEDVDDMVEKIQSLIDNPILLATLRQGALKRAEDFMFERYATQIMEWYNWL